MPHSSADKMRARVLTPARLEGHCATPTTRPQRDRFLAVRRRPVLLLAVVALTAAACGGGSGDASATDTTAAGSDTAAPITAAPATTATAPAPTTGGDPAPPPADLPTQLDFTAATVAGGQVTGADFAGQDLVVWFWAPW